VLTCRRRGSPVSIWAEQPDLARWIEAETGGVIVAAERQGRWRVQWMVDVETGGSPLPLVARMPRDPAYVRLSDFLSHYDTAYEARVLAAMDSTPIPTPHFYGFHEPTETILIERVTGSADFRAVSPELARPLLDEYIAQMVAI